MLPIECESRDPEATFDCDNPEQNGTNVNVVSQHLVTVDSRYGDYGRCNDRERAYHCTCGSSLRPRPCGPAVGMAEVSYIRPIHENARC